MRAIHKKTPDMQHRDTRLLGPLSGILAIATAFTTMGTACAQDARKVSEPSLPAACAVLIAAKAAPDDAGTDDTARIQKAIDKCSAGQAVWLATGNEKRAFVSGPLSLRSGVSLVVDAGATLYASTDPAAYDKGGKTCGTNDAKGKGCRPFISADNTRGSGIMGDGAIDGQGGHLIDGKTESWWQIARRAQKEDSRQNVPRLIEVSQSQEFTLYRISLRNSPNFHVTLNQVDGFTAWGAKIDTPATARNTDGIDPISSRNITITHSYIRTGDDNVAIKAGNNGATENVSILHNHFYTGHGMSIGSETNGGVRHILVDDLSMDGTTSGLRIKSDVTRGGAVSDVRYRNVCLRNVRAPIDVGTHYNPQAAGALIPRYTDIVFEHVHSLTAGRAILQGYDVQNPLKATLNDVVIDGEPVLEIKHALFSPSQHAQLNPAGATGIDCTQRFAAFPAADGKSFRPQLSASQAQNYAYAEVLKYTGSIGNETLDPWNPLASPLASQKLPVPDYTVDPAARANGSTVFNSVQAAVSKAVIDSAAAAPAQRKNRLNILVKPGVYRELLYVPESDIPITLYGSDADAGKTKISATLDAAVTGRAYAKQFGAQFADTEASITAMYAGLKDRETISTNGSAVVWIKNQGFQAKNITFENAYNKDVGNARSECTPSTCGDLGVNAQMAVVHHQAVALMVDGADKAQFENVRLIGFQDTLYVRSPEAGKTARSFFNKSYIEGDVDFIFGDTIAYFYQSEIRSLGDRSTSYVAAPNTNYKSKYGFVFDRCRFTHDGTPNALAGKFYLARQWFHNQRCTPYGPMAIAGYTCQLGDTNIYQAPNGVISKSVLETVGKIVVLNSKIGAHINKTHPWSDWNKKGTLPYRPAQFNSDDYWANLIQASIDPVRHLGYSAKPATPEPYLAEFNNTEQ